MTRAASEILSSTIFEDRFPPYDLTVVNQFIVILTKKTLLFKFPLLEFRFQSFFELYMHFKGFVYLRMRKLNAVSQIPADAHDWCQMVLSFNVPKFIPKYWTIKQLSQLFVWSVRTLAQYSCGMEHLLSSNLNVMVLNDQMKSTNVLQ